MDKQQQPGITFDAILLSDIHFERKPYLDKNLEIDVSFEAKRSIEGNKGSVQIITKLQLKTETEVFVKLELVHVGVFSVTDEPNMSLEHFLEFNAPALIFPYIRNEISSITCSAGLTPVVLPPMNIMAMIKQNEEK